MGKAIKDIKKVKILINSAFVGSYADRVDNLSHEVINFVKEDKNRFYIYLAPYGNLKRTTVEDRIEYIYDLDYVLFVKNVGEGMVEVIAKAEVGDKNNIFAENIEIKQGTTKIKSKDGVEKYSELINKANITYGEKTLAEIFKIQNADNLYKELVVTMQVKDIKLPKTLILLTNKKDLEDENNNIYFLKGKNDNKLLRIANSSMRTRFCEDDENTNVLEKIIKNNDLWGESVKSYKEQNNSIVIADNFFKATLQQDNEVMFSNMLFYLFQNYPELFKDFANKVLGINDIGSIENNPCWIMREDEKMDLKIITDKYYIVIENKIKSGINGVTKDKKTNDFLRDDQGKIKSQLSNYFIKVTKEIDEEFKKEENINRQKPKFLGFIFHPNYNDINLDDYSCGGKYVKIKYKAIHEFFKDYKCKAHSDKYMEDFINALKKHTEPTDNEKRNDLMARLKKRIEG